MARGGIDDCWFCGAAPVGGGCVVTLGRPDGGATEAVAVPGCGSCLRRYAAEIARRESVARGCLGRLAASALPVALALFGLVAGPTSAIGIALLVAACGAGWWLLASLSRLLADRDPTVTARAAAHPAVAELTARGWRILPTPPGADPP
ncbi:hypothetical protein [Streptomyces sp. B6B3]|uniref:hypothetical protein n=1 Tax=Streptomyces sp. B6B3 TaxID=3153570 RepID=UPI00325F90AE